MPTKATNPIQRGLRRFGRDRRGVAAVEFALVLPVMLTFYFGVAEVANALMVNRKVTALNRTLADLTAQAGSITDSDMNSIFDAAQTVMMPYTEVQPGMVVASIVIDDTGRARVCWSSQRNGTALGRGTAVTIPAEMRIPSTSLIMARTTYRFTPVIGHLITGAITLGDRPLYMRPRNGRTGGTQSIEQIDRSSFNMCPNFS